MSVLVTPSCISQHPAVVHYCNTNTNQCVSVCCVLGEWSADGGTTSTQQNLLAGFLQLWLHHQPQRQAWDPTQLRQYRTHYNTKLLYTKLNYTTVTFKFKWITGSSSWLSCWLNGGCRCPRCCPSRIAWLGRGSSPAVPCLAVLLWGTRSPPNCLNWRQESSGWSGWTHRTHNL